MDLYKKQYFAPFTVKSDADGTIHFSGIGSSTSVDRQNERMSKKALTQMSQDLIGKTVFFNHDHDGLGVGIVTKATVEATQGGFVMPVEVKGTKAKGMEDVIIQIKEGVLNAMSIGGIVRKKEMVYDESLKKDIGEIQDVEGVEISVVGVPANKDAQIQFYTLKSEKGATNMAEPQVPVAEVAKASPLPVAETKLDAVKENGPSTPTVGANAISDDRISSLTARLDALERAHTALMSDIAKVKAPAGPIATHTRSFEDVLNAFEKSIDSKFERIETVVKSATVRAKGLVETETAKPATPSNPVLAFMEGN